MLRSLFLLTHRPDARAPAEWPGSGHGRRFLVPALIGMVAATGCQVRKYELEMTPRADRLERKLTVFEQRTDGEKSVDVAVGDSELARIAAQYGVAGPQSGGPRHSFAREFAGRLPDDVGGCGTYTRWSTSLGTATAYVERVRGDDDIAGDLDNRRAAVQRLVALLAGWLDQELAGTPELPKLRGFLEGDFRRDLINLSVYIKSLELVAADDRLVAPADRKGTSGALAQHGVRVGQYFIERGYVDPAQLPDWIYAVDQTLQERPGTLLALLQRWLASRIGVPADQPVPASLARLSDTESIEASLRSYLRASEDYQALLKKHEQASGPEREPPEPWKVLEELAFTAFLPGGMFLHDHQLTATLALPCEPLGTNGVWQADERRVEWKAALVPIDAAANSLVRPALPDVLFAFWVEPAAEKQVEHFGKVVLTDQDLVQYCLWRCGLPDEKARLWEDFLGGLRPGAGLGERISGFRFADESPDAATPSASRQIRETFVQELANPN